MIPSAKWFPSSLQDRAAWFENFAANFADVAVSLGFVAADATAVTNDAAMMTFLASITVSLESYKDAVRAFRKTLTEAPIGDATPAFPADLEPTVPAAVPTGIFERLDNLVKRIRYAPNYTPEIGALLGIVPTRSGSGEITGLDKPMITANPQPGNEVAVKFVKGSSSGIFIQCHIDKGADFEDYGRFLKSPAILEIPQSANELPRSVEIRARFLDGNDPVGDWSDTVTVQTIP